MATYRMIISYLPEKEVYQARAPELSGAVVEAPTRAEAVAELEEEISAQVEVIKDQGGVAPKPLDTIELDGKLSLEVTPELHRELLFLAASDNTELSVLVNDLLVRAVSRRWGGARRSRGGGGNSQPSNDGNRKRPREGQGSRYHNIMEDRAEFIDYVRKLDSGGGRPKAGGRRRKK